MYFGCEYVFIDVFQLSIISAWIVPLVQKNTSFAEYITCIIIMLQVSAEMTKELPKNEQMEGSIVSTSHIGLSFRLETKHFPGGSLSLVCECTFPNIPGAQTLKTEETAMLAVSNQILAQQPPKSMSGSVKMFYFSMINNNVIIFSKIVYFLSNRMNFY